MSTEAQRVIEGAYKILSVPERWARNAYARNAAGRSITCVEGADSFCLLGSVDASLLTLGLTLNRARALDAITRELPSGRSIPSFNDDTKTTHADVLRVLREAHKLAGNGEPEVTL